MNVQKIVTALSNSQRGLCNGSLCDDTQKFLGCAVGELLYQADPNKYNPHKLLDLEPTLMGADRDNTEARKTLRKEYGLTCTQFRSIISANDNFTSGDDKARQEHVISHVREMGERQQRRACKQST